MLPVRMAEFSATSALTEDDLLKPHSCRRGHTPEHWFVLLSTDRIGIADRRSVVIVMLPGQESASLSAYARPDSNSAPSLKISFSNSMVRDVALMLARTGRNVAADRALNG